MSRHTNLGNLSIGDKACVVRLKPGAQQFRRKLLSMGVIPGSIVKIIRMAPLGDPIEVALSGYRLCLRRQEAVVIDVEILA